MLVNIHFSNFDKKLKYNLEETIKIIEIKELIEKEEDIPFTKTELKLIFSGRVLDNNKCLKDIKFSSGDTISALGKKIVQIANEINNEINNEEESNNLSNNFLANEYLSYLNYFNENPLNDDLLNSYIYKYKFLINNVIDNNTFCNFIKNKDDINLISSNSSNISSDEYKNSALQIKEYISLLIILSNKMFYVIIIPTIHSYKIKYNLNEQSNTEILSSLFSKINDLFNEYIELNGNLELSYHESDNNENSLFTNIFNMINTIFTQNSEPQNVLDILNLNNLSNNNESNLNNIFNSLLNPNNLSNNNESNLNNIFNSLLNPNNLSNNNESNLNNFFNLLSNPNILSNNNNELNNNELNNELNVDSNVIESSSVNNLINSYNYDIELLNQMKDLGLTDTNKCKFCLNLSNGNLEMAINYYYEINIDFANNLNNDNEDDDDDDDEDNY
jgi:hypothetical protein